MGSRGGDGGFGRKIERERENTQRRTHYCVCLPTRVFFLTSTREHQLSSLSAAPKVEDCATYIAYIRTFIRKICVIYEEGEKTALRNWQILQEKYFYLKQNFLVIIASGNNIETVK